MKKSDLRNRMVVETRIGNKYIVVDDMLMRNYGFLDIEDYDEQLMYYNGGLKDERDFDIVKVYSPVEVLDIETVNDCIWDRREDELKSCPFCGKSVAKVVPISEMDESFDPYRLPEQFAVLCNCYKGGCGALTGWQMTKEEAIERWNTREQATGGAGPSLGIN